MIVQLPARANVILKSDPRHLSARGKRKLNTPAACKLPTFPYDIPFRLCGNRWSRGVKTKPIAEESWESNAFNSEE